MRGNISFISILLLINISLFGQFTNTTPNAPILGRQTTADGLIYRYAGNSTPNWTPTTNRNAYLGINDNGEIYRYNGSSWVRTTVTSLSVANTGFSLSSSTGNVTLSGTLDVDNGGTGATSLTGVLIGNGTSAFSALSGTASQLLRRNSSNTAYEFFTPSYITDNIYISNGTLTGNRILTANGNTLSFNGSNAGSFLTISNTGIPLVSDRNSSFTTEPADILELYSKTSSTASTGFGGAVKFYLESPTGSNLHAGSFGYRWSNTSNDSYAYITTRVGAGEGLVSEKLRINSNGQVTFSNYGSGSYTGAVAKYLATTSAGNIIEADIPSSITGTGVANKVAFFTNASTLSTNTNLHWDNTEGRLGIGTSSPAMALDIIGRYRNTTSSASPIAEFGTNDGGTNNNQLSLVPTYGNGVVGANGMYFTLGVAADLGFRATPSGIANLMISSTGNVGIGTTTPRFKLHVFGNGQTTANLTDAGNRDDMLFLSTNSISGGSGGVVAFGTLQSNTNNSIGFAAIKGLLENGDNNTLGSLAFSTRGITTDTQLTERMRITATGNVGIGTETPSQKLDVVGTVLATAFSGSGASLTNLNASNLSTGTVGTARLGTGTANSTTYLRGDNTWQALTSSQWVTAGSDIYYTTGEVGIGVTAPLAPLHINGAAVSNRGQLSIAPTTTGLTQFTMYKGQATGTDLVMTMVAGTDDLFYTAQPSATSKLQFRLGGTSANESRMEIDATGNIGMGVASGTSAKVVVRGGGATSATAGLRVNNSGNNPALIARDDLKVGVNSSITNIKNTLQVNGTLGRSIPLRITSAPTYTVLESTTWLIIDYSGNYTVALPAAGDFTGRELTIKTLKAFTVISNASNVKPIDSDTVGTAILPATAGAWALLVSDGTNWIIMQRG
jgi:hypothetical protein